MVDNGSSGRGPRTWIPVFRESASGIQVAILSMGWGENFGLMPVSFTAKQMKNNSGWVKVLRQPAAREVPQEGVHYTFVEPAGWRPRQVKFGKWARDPIIAMEQDSARTMQADFAVVSVSEEPVEAHTAPCTPPHKELMSVRTPETPSPGTPSPLGDLLRSSPDASTLGANLSELQR